MKINLKNSHNLINFGWILAAMVVLFFNGQALMIVLDQPALRHSNLINGIKDQWRQLEALNIFLRERHEVEKNNDLDRIFVRYMPKSNKKALPALTVSQKKTFKKRQGLPRVTGILEISDEQGYKKSLVVIEGKNRAIHDQVQGFTIEKITTKGIVVSKEGLNWFVAVPKGRFSITHRGGL